MTSGQQQLKASADPAVEAELDRLPTTPIVDLRKRYRELFRTDSPKAFGPDLLRRSIGIGSRTRTLDRTAIHYAKPSVYCQGRNAMTGQRWPRLLTVRLHLLWIADRVSNCNEIGGHLSSLSCYKQMCSVTRQWKPLGATPQPHLILST